MPKHPTSPRVPKPEPEPDDKFLFFIERAGLWARHHTRALIIGGIVLAVGIIAAVYYIDSQRRVEAEAAARLNEVQQTVMTGNVPLAIRDLQTYLAAFGGTRAAREGRLILADLLLTEGRPAEAIQALGRLHRDLDEPAGIAAAQLQAAALESLEQHDDAIDTYQRIASNARFEFQRREALADAARVALDSDRPDLAAEFLDRLVQTFPEGDPGRSYYEMWRAEATARAARISDGTPTTPAAATDQPVTQDTVPTDSPQQSN